MLNRFKLNNIEKHEDSIELKCSNNKCKKVTKIYLDKDKTLCSDCGSELQVTKKLSKRLIRNLAIATGVGYALASGPEWVQTDRDIIQMYESMNACMYNARSYEKQRDICACAFAKTYEEYKYFNVKDAFRQNINECY
ncbi:hypothetical protein K7G90_000509 [Pasteurella canis]|uniref:TFIIB-type domain-containing protein n=1 Tax=Pasteurella canis TaxID=753 RepID=A0ABQ4VH23_9PAST|nr:hypothetical protein [Pasteurella canis]MXN87577.1 hypothetical protein [Pasteurella canis]UAY78224.1 hypothetical protein K7G90_000509 [Pasteurella canis]UDW84299.1 hypothetical protein K7G91_000566 [Pasteurella canis]UEC23743.1 hypothetical protein K7G93_000496 [Pasteurella canis]SPY33322.1 Uncharacterised protein [Pasteurella canis]